MSVTECNGIIEEAFKDSYYNLEDIKTMSMGSNLMVCPYDAMWYFKVLKADATLFHLFANTDKIQRKFTNLDFKSEESSQTLLCKLMLKSEIGDGFAYVIRLQNLPIGMLWLDSPKYNEWAYNLRIWTINFFIFQEYEHKGIMYNALIRVLRQLKNMGVPRIYALVEPENSSCINLLNKGLFYEVENLYFSNKNPNEAKPIVFMIDLTRLTFK